ncbi:MAG: PA domain-containing protein [Gemmatimonadaceae bacterium]
MGARSVHIVAGWDARIERFDVLFPTPKVRVLEMLAPTKFTAKLEEPILKEDLPPTSVASSSPRTTRTRAMVMPTGPLVYVNYGVPADYELLERNGISVKGAIVIARYGGSWRGIKPKVAYEHGAVGALIYSDPGDDGLRRGRYVSQRSPSAQGRRAAACWTCRRIRVTRFTLGVGASPGATRLDRKDAITIMKIPVLPISCGRAATPRQAMTGLSCRAAGAADSRSRIVHGPAGSVHLRAEFGLEADAAVRRDCHVEGLDESG